MDIIKRSCQRRLANRQKEIKRLREELAKKEEELRTITLYINDIEKAFVKFIIADAAEHCEELNEQEAYDYIIDLTEEAREQDE